MLENKRSPNNYKGLGFTDCKDSTSEVKQAKIVEKADKRPSDVADLFKMDPDSTNEGIRAFDSARIKFKPSISSRTDFVRITNKTSASTTVENAKHPLALKHGQGLMKSKIQPRPEKPLRRQNIIYPKGNYNQVNQNYHPHNGYQFQQLCSLGIIPAISFC
ncbi:hypothetical protein Tco_0861761 [Tanacetum coccineum]